MSRIPLVPPYQLGYDFALQILERTITEEQQLGYALDAIAEHPKRGFHTGFLECVNREIKRGAIKVSISGGCL